MFTSEQSDKTLVKALVEAGCGSRRQMTDAIRDGRVKVNGIVAEAFTARINSLKDEITLDDKVISYSSSKYEYILLNKPVGYQCTTDDPHSEKTVLDLLPDELRNTYPAGRLDTDSRGLVIMTNDGDFTYKVTHPKFNKDKEYLIRTHRPLTSDDRKKLENGIELEEGTTSPAKIKIIKVSAPVFQYSITIHEGRKRQIRRMFASLDYKIIDLQRIRIGKITIGDLQEGSWRKLNHSEIESLK
jgi:pseudouridine synthase